MHTAPTNTTAMNNTRSSFSNINVKKLQFIHMLTATGLRTSNTAKIKTVILLYHCTSSYVNVYSKM